MARYKWIILLLAFFPALSLSASEGNLPFFVVADSFRTRSWNYECLYYFRGTTNLRRRNFLYVAFPNRGYYRRGGRKLLSEHVGVLQYNTQTSFTRKRRYEYGSVDGYDMASQYIVELFQLTPFNDYLVSGDHILSPLVRVNAKHYKYTVDSISKGKIYYSYRSRRNKTQLSLSGQFVYDPVRQSINSFSFRGYFGYARFNVKVKMGTWGDECHWPKECEATFSYLYYGNIIEGQARFFQDYYNMENDYVPRVNKKEHNDLTPLFSLSLDTTVSRHDSLAVAHYRYWPLTPEEEQMYADAAPKWRKSKIVKADNQAIVNDSTLRRKHSKPWLRTLGTIGEGLFRSYDFTTSQYSNIKIYNPDISYSDWRGISYQHDGRMHINHSSGRNLQMFLRLGYNFRPKQFVGRFRTYFTYLPREEGEISLQVEQRGMRGSTELLQSLERTDTTKERSMLFRDFMVRLEHKINIIYGMRLTAGIIYHRRTTHREPQEILDQYGIKRYYVSFSPHLNLEYTPKLKYFYNDGKRIRVGSSWPTFMLDYERGTSGILEGSAHFERWEATVTKRQNISQQHHLMWKIGGGLFTNRRNVDFVFYEYFNEGITDPTWRDGLSGCFHALKGEFYNNSYRYLRAHAVLESPVLLLGRISTYLLRGERLYFGALVTDKIFPYIEIGYGLSTHIIDISAFTSIAKKEAVNSGIKFTLHLFD